MLLGNVETAADKAKQIYDLWMGRITSKEGALQLLLIIDYIAECARQKHRFDILCCLAGGREQVLGADNMSDTYKDRLSTVSVFNSGSVGRTYPSDLGNCQTEQDAVMEDVGMMPLTKNRQVREKIGAHHFLRWLRVPVAPHYQSQPYTIRHANMVMFSFSHLSIPSDKILLERLLVSIYQPHTAPIQEIASSLLSNFQDQREGVVVTTRQRVDLLKSEWLKLSPATTAFTETVVRALFSVRTFVRNDDWQIERELLCISCSRKAAQVLASIAGAGAEALRISTEWAAETLEFPSSSFAELRSITGRHSATAAINNRVFRLMQSSKHDGYQWVPRSEVNESTRWCFLWSCGIRMDKLPSASINRQVNKAMEVLGTPRLPKNIKNLVQTLPLLEGSAALLRRILVEGDKSSISVYCLMVFKQVDFYDAQAIREIIDEVKARGMSHTVVLGCPSIDSIEACKEPIDADLHGSVLDQWIG